PDAPRETEQAMVNGSTVNGSTAWTRADIGDLAGRTAVVTGASSGIGFETARHLAAHGASVVLACRDQARGRQAARQIASTGDPAGTVGTVGIARTASVQAGVLDLADLVSVRRFAEELLEQYPGIDILVNNAGIAGGPRRSTADGFEAHFGVNHLGH